MNQLDFQERALLKAFETGQLTSVATEDEVQAVHAAARATVVSSQREAARACCEKPNAVNEKAGGSCTDEHSPL